MNPEKTESDFAARIKSAIEPAREFNHRDFRNAFAARLKQAPPGPVLCRSSSTDAGSTFVWAARCSEPR